MSADHILARFPKARPPLPVAYEAIYAEQYKSNRNGATPAASLAQRLESWMHRKVAADVAVLGPRATLELGAGTLNQLPYEPRGEIYDIVEPFALLFEDSPHRPRVRQIYSGVEEVPSSNLYDRITSVAVLEHLCDLPGVLARASRLLSPDGVFRAAIPSEGGLLWGLGWRVGTGLEFRRRHDLDYGVMMRHEHVNTAVEIEALVKALFVQVRIQSFGLGRQLSLYRFIEAQAPRPAVADAWLARQGRASG
jgi:hypothetical protein